MPSVQEFWAAENDPDADPEHPAPVMQCLVCGGERPVLRRLQLMVKGIRGGQGSGTAIISANAEAFESYGLEASLIAPTCAECGERFTKALNSLLADRAHHIVLGGATLVFWTREAHPFSLRDLLDTPQPEQVRELVESARSGRPAAVDETAFYAAVLSASRSRAVVRDWIDTTVAGVKQSLACWFQRQAIVDAWGRPAEPLGIYALAAATVRDAQKDLAPPTLRALWRSALGGTPLPASLLYEAVRRNRVEERAAGNRIRPRVTRPCAALIKLVLCSRAAGAARDSMEQAMAQLDPTNTAPAYLCGRLLAVIEEAQHIALPGVKATVVDRFYGSASTAPASVFGRLLQGVRPHLAKLRRDRPSAFHALQARLEEIQAGLGGFPRVLTLEEQGLFALGYYHQRAWDRAQAREAKARKAAGQQLDTVDDGIADLADAERDTQGEEE